MRTSSNRTLSYIVGAIVLVALIVVATVSTWSVQERDPKTPEGVVQAYMTAVMQHHIDQALALMEPESTCTAENFQQSYVDATSRVDLVSLSVAGDSADVHLRIEHGNGDPLGGTWNEDQYISLVRVDGNWRIHGTPYPLFTCGSVK